MKKLTLISTFLFILGSAKSQSDSLRVVNTLQELLLICKNKTFPKAANYIIYRGSDKKRNWKDYAKYKNVEEKQNVDGVCERINSTVNQDPNYKIVKFFTEKESEGKWYIVEVSYLKSGEPKKALFAFLKVKGHFGIGDID